MHVYVQPPIPFFAVLRRIRAHICALTFCAEQCTYTNCTYNNIVAQIYYVGFPCGTATKHAWIIKVANDKCNGMCKIVIHGEMKSFNFSTGIFVAVVFCSINVHHILTYIHNCVQKFYFNCQHYQTT